MRPSGPERPPRSRAERVPKSTGIRSFNLESALVEHLLERGEASVLAHEAVVKELMSWHPMGAIEFLKVVGESVQLIQEVCGHVRGGYCPIGDKINVGDVPEPVRAGCGPGPGLAAAAGLARNRALAILDHGRLRSGSPRPWTPFPGIRLGRQRTQKNAIHSAYLLACAEPSSVATHRAAGGRGCPFVFDILACQAQTDCEQSCAQSRVLGDSSGVAAPPPGLPDARRRSRRRRSPACCGGRHDG